MFVSVGEVNPKLQIAVLYAAAALWMKIDCFMYYYTRSPKVKKDQSESKSCVAVSSFLHHRHLQQTDTTRYSCRRGSVAEVQEVTYSIWEIILTWMKNDGLCHIMQFIREHDWRHFCAFLNDCSRKIKHSILCILVVLYFCACYIIVLSINQTDIMACNPSMPPFAYVMVQ